MNPSPSRTVKPRKAHESLGSEETRSIYLSSIFWMTMLMLFGVGIPCWLAFGPNWGLSLGAMSAFWAGPGYGVMLGASRVSLRQERQAKLSAPGPAEQKSGRRAVAGVPLRRAA